MKELTEKKVIIVLLIFLLGIVFPYIYYITPKLHKTRELSNLNLSSNNLCWRSNTPEKVRSISISDDGEYIVASTFSPDSSIYLFDNQPSISKTPLWSYSNKNKSHSVTYRSTETLYFNEYWYEYEHIKAQNQIHFSVQSSPSVISFAIWDQPFENLPYTTEFGNKTDTLQLTSDSYDFYWIFLRSGSTIEYSFNATDLIDFFIADTNSLYLWVQGLSTSFFVDLQNTTSGDGSFTVPTTQDYYVVWYNVGLSTISVDYIINYTALNIPDLSVADIYVEAVDFIPEQTYIVPNEGNWYFFIYFDPMNSPEESTTITFDVIYNIGNSMYAVDISGNGDQIVAGDDNYVYLLNKSVTIPKEPVWDFPGDDSFNDIAISNDGYYTVAITGKGTLYLLFNLPLGLYTELWNYTSGDDLHSVAISANGDYIVASGWDGKLYLFNKYTSTPIWTYLTGTKIYSIAMSLDGNYIVAGTHDSQVLLFNKTNSTPLWSYFAGGEIFSVAINDNGTYIIAGGSEGNLYLFNRSSETPLWKFSVGASFGYVYSHHCIAISQNGNYITAGTQDSMLYYFNKLSSEPIWSHVLGGEINAIAMSVNGSYIAVGSSDHRVYLFGYGVDCQLSSKETIIPGFCIPLTIGLICLFSIISIKKLSRKIDNF